MELPCRHIMKLLAQSEKNMFVPDACAQRWTCCYYNESHPILCNKSNTDLNLPSASTLFTKHKSVAEVDKYKKMSFANEKYMPTYVTSH